MSATEGRNRTRERNERHILEGKKTARESESIATEGRKLHGSERRRSTRACEPEVIRCSGGASEFAGEVQRAEAVLAIIISHAPPHPAL